METIHGNVQIVRAHLSGLKQLQTLGISLDKYTYSSLAPIIQSVRQKSFLWRRKLTY